MEHTSRLKMEKVEDLPPAYEMAISEEKQASNELVTNCTVGKQRFKAFINQTVTVLKATSQGITIVFDFLLLICFLAIMIFGCQILKDDYEETTIVYHTWFYVVGMVMVVFGCVNCFIFCPLGIIGSWKKKRTFLKWHNIWILLNLIVCSVLFYSFHQSGKKTEQEKLKQFSEKILETYDVCVMSMEGKEECCCDPKLKNVKPKCWSLDKTIKESSITKGDKLMFAKKCQNGEDYFRRASAFINKFYWILMVVNVVMVGVLFFGLITLQLVAVPDEDELERKRRRRRRRAPKNRLEWTLQKMRYHICRRLLLILLSVLFVFGYIFVKLWMKDFTVRMGVGNFKFNVWNATIYYIQNEIL